MNCKQMKIHFSVLHLFTFSQSFLNFSCISIGKLMLQFAFINLIDCDVKGLQVPCTTCWYINNFDIVCFQFIRKWLTPVSWINSWAIWSSERLCWAQVLVRCGTKVSTYAKIVCSLLQLFIECHICHLSGNKIFGLQWDVFAYLWGEKVTGQGMT